MARYKFYIVLYCIVSMTKNQDKAELKFSENKRCH